MQGAKTVLTSRQALLVFAYHNRHAPVLTREVHDGAAARSCARPLLCGTSSWGHWSRT